MKTKAVAFAVKGLVFNFSEVVTDRRKNMATKTKRTLIREAIARAFEIADDDPRILSAADEILDTFLPQVEVRTKLSENGEVFKFYEENFELLTGYNSQRISDAIDLYTAAWVLDAFRVCVDQGKKSLAYAEGILRRWKREGKREIEPKPVEPMPVIIPQVDESQFVPNPYRRQP